MHQHVPFVQGVAEDIGAFSARFRELTGESPSGYRRRVVAEGGPPPVPGCFVLMWSNPATLEKPGTAAAS